MWYSRPPEDRMKITCERCSAQYDLDDRRIPPSGFTMKCPACLHSFVVHPAGAAPPTPTPPPTPPAPKREIALSTFDEDETPLPKSAPGLIQPPAEPQLT